MTGAVLFERFDESARRALFFARIEAGEIGGVAIETEHLLLGVLSDCSEMAAVLCARVGLSCGKARLLIREHSGGFERVAVSIEIPFSDAAQQSLTHAAAEADRLSDVRIACEHLLLGLLHVEGSLAASLCAQHGLTLDAAREAVGALRATQARRASAVAGLDTIEALVDRLPLDSAGARDLLARIHESLDALRIHLA